MAVVRVKNPIRLDRYSEPQPDLSLLRRRDGGYRDRHPGPDDVLLVIEVAKTSLTIDLDVKLPLYARAVIPEVWVIDLDNSVLLAHRDPSEDGYRSVESHNASSEVRVEALPEVCLALDGILS